MHYTHHLAPYAAVSQIVPRDASERAWQVEAGQGAAASR